MLTYRMTNWCPRSGITVYGSCHTWHCSCEIYPCLNCTVFCGFAWVVEAVVGHGKEMLRLSLLTSIVAENTISKQIENSALMDLAGNFRDLKVIGLGDYSLQITSEEPALSSD